jgi:hypothetical protein
MVLATVGRVIGHDHGGFFAPIRWRIGRSYALPDSHGKMVAVRRNIHRLLVATS